MLDFNSSVNTVRRYVLSVERTGIAYPLEWEDEIIKKLKSESIECDFLKTEDWVTSKQENTILVFNDKQTILNYLTSNNLGSDYVVYGGKTFHSPIEAPKNYKLTEDTVLKEDKIYRFPVVLEKLVVYYKAAEWKNQALKRVVYT